MVVVVLLLSNSRSDNISTVCLTSGQEDLDARTYDDHLLPDYKDLFLENRLLYLYEVKVESGFLEFLTRTSRRCRESGEEGPVRRCPGGGGVAINSPSVA